MEALPILTNRPFIMRLYSPSANARAGVERAYKLGECNIGGAYVRVNRK